MMWCFIEISSSRVVWDPDLIGQSLFETKVPSPTYPPSSKPHSKHLVMVHARLNSLLPVLRMPRRTHAIPPPSPGAVHARTTLHGPPSASIRDCESCTMRCSLDLYY